MERMQYHPRYLAGIVLFNEQAFFEAHEVWEGIWLESAGLERKFYQGLIQVAVALCHFGNGNVRGALKLYHSSRNYMQQCGSPFLGFDIPAFWEQMERCFAGLLAGPEPERSLRPDPALVPVLRRGPLPAAWADPAAFLEEEEQENQFQGSRS